MNGFVILGLVLAGYAIAGLLTLWLAAWRDPDAFEGSSAEANIFMAFVFWPVILGIELLDSFTKVVVRSKRNNLKVRAELEKELKAAKKELEDFMRGAA